MAQIPAGSAGVLVTVSVAPFVIPNGATASVQFSGPGGTVTRTATVAGTSAITYTSVAADFAVAGRYEIRAVITSAGNSLYGDIDDLYVTAFP